MSLEEEVLNEDCIYLDPVEMRCIMYNMNVKLFSCIPDCDHYKSCKEWYRDDCLRRINDEYEEQKFAQ